MIKLSAAERELIRGILKKYPYRFYFFGSRAKGSARPFSDLDICYQEDIPEHIVAQIIAEFDDSDLPFRVDLVGYSRMTEDFKNSIKDDLLIID